MVTGRTDSATWVRIFTPPAEGLLVNADTSLDVGQKLRVRLGAPTWSVGSSTSNRCIDMRRS